jgi:hypothetical protein
MLESQRAANGARVVALKLQQTRLKAMREDRPCGVEFMRYENESRVSLQMRTIKDAPNFIELNVAGYEVRCRVSPNGNGTATIKLLKKEPAEIGWTEIDEVEAVKPNTTSPPEDTKIVETWMRKVISGLKIGFNRKQPPGYDLKDSFTINDCNAPMPTVQIPVDGKYPDAVHFNVTQRPTAMLNSITVLPRGTVVDLQYSGHDESMLGEGDIRFRDPSPNSNVTRVNSSVIIMFSPAGYVDRFYIDGTGNSLVNKPFRGVFYLLVGEWDKITEGEDSKDNLRTESNFWVTIKDRDGTVRMSPNTVGDNVSDRRKHANQDLYNNIGGL